MAKTHCNLQAFQPIPFSSVIIEDRFWLPRLEINRNFTLLHQYRQLFQSGAIENFKRVTGEACGTFVGLYFSDSDVYKWLEASSYSLKSHPDPKLESLVDETIDFIAAAQEADGYVNTYIQLVEPDKKFTNFGQCHELYCFSHLIQAGIAHYDATGKRSLLAVICRSADHLVEVFGSGKFEAIDGHAGIEMALIDLYRLTGIKDYFSLAEFFIERRGRPDSRLRWELGHLDKIAGKPGKPGQNNLKYYGTYETYDGRYAQDHLPVREQGEVVGHAVRAMYLYCGMADLYSEAVENDDRTLLAALERLWNHLTTRRMYITGGVGPARANEGFTRDFDLPNDTACAESCAAVGMILWNHRLLQITGESRYADLLEKVLYNAFLVGVSLDGTKYFYNNPLQSIGDCHREEWYECACCPPNIARILTSLGGFIYSFSKEKYESPEQIFIHLFIQSKVKLKVSNGSEVTLTQAGSHPWDGKIRISIDTKHPVRLQVWIRIPGWCKSFLLEINNELITKPRIEKGYVVIDRQWFSDDRIRLNLSMSITKIVANPQIWQLAGRVALQRGPLIYCIEDADYPVSVERVFLSGSSILTARYVDDLLGGVVVLEGQALTSDLQEWADQLYRNKDNIELFKPVSFRAVPYYCWDNRTPGAMAVWLIERD